MLNMLQNKEAIQGCDPIPLLTKNPNIGGIRVMANQTIPKRYPRGQAPKICIVDGCSIETWARGHCRNHYYRMRNYGDALARTKYDKNDYTVDGDIAYVHLYNNSNKRVASTVIDKVDLEYVLKEKWGLCGTGHARNSAKPRVRLSRYIIAYIPNGYEIDHINRNTLDNRRCNLRLATHLQNCFNTARKKNASGYKGVYLDKRINCWNAGIGHKGKKIYIGCFTSKIEAAKAYNKKALELFGEFALLNKI
jgi:hypothetical protein